MAVSTHLPEASAAHDVPSVEPGARAGGFRHEVIFHGDGTDGFLRQTMPLIEQALDRQGPVLLAVSAERIVALQQALGSRAAGVGFADIRRLGSNPARIIPAWRAFLRGAGSGEGEPLGIGEPVWPGRSTAELDECWRHEALLNLAFDAGGPWHLVCPYDLEALEDHVIEAAHICHPIITGPERSGPNRCFRRHIAAFDGTLEEPGPEVSELHFGETELREIRRRIASWACLEGLLPEATEDLVLAADEIATNSIRHGGGSGRLRMWREGPALLCEIRDRGQMRDPLLGRVLPGEEAGCGRGMWIVNQLCDLVQVRSSAAGSQIRLHKRLR